MAMQIKDKIKEIAEIANECPEKFQNKCFEILLEDLLKQKDSERDSQSQPDKTASKIVDGREKTKDKGEIQEEEFSEGELHIKVKSFLSKNDLSVKDINQIFYKEKDKIAPLFDDLKTTGFAESQIRIALLLALKEAIETGNFEFNGEKVRQLCQARKCYDMKNFTSNFNNNSEYFDNFEKYNKAKPTLRLGNNGKKFLVQAIKDLGS